jgi:hypothetical protein
MQYEKDYAILKYNVEVTKFVIKAEKLRKWKDMSGKFGNTHSRKDDDLLKLDRFL